MAHPYDQPQVFNPWWPDAIETVTPHDIHALAETRRRDPELAMRIAEASAPKTQKEQANEPGRQNHAG